MGRLVSRSVRLSARALLLSASFALAGCGAIYHPRTVSEASREKGAPLDVRVVEITPETVSTANRSPYRPRSLPAAFSRVVGQPVGEAATPALPTPPTEPAAPPAPTRLVLPPEPPAHPYRIGVADVLLLSTPTPGSTVEQLTGILAAQTKRQGYTVQDDGAISIPDVGRVEVAGLTLEEAEQALFQALVKAGIDPTFSLEIAEFHSQSVNVGGAVGNATVVPITLKPLTLGAALSAAGGVKVPDADYARILIFRDGKLYQIPFREFLRRPELGKLRLIDGDAVYVDEGYQLDRAQAYFREQITLLNLKQSARQQALQNLRAEFDLERARLEEERSNFQAKVALDAVPRDYVYLAGEVGTQGRFALPFGRKAVLADALFSQSGINASSGNPAQIYVLRGERSGQAVTAWHLDAANAANMVLATRFELRPNDIVFVSEEPVTSWNRALQQIMPSFVISVANAATK